MCLKENPSHYHQKIKGMNKILDSGKSLLLNKVFWESL